MTLSFSLHRNRHLRNCLKKQKLSEEGFLAACQKRYEAICHQAGKIKPVAGASFGGLPVLEYKLPLKPQPLRVAYVKEGDRVEILYASEDIVKARFSKKMLASDLVD